MSARWQRFDAALAEAEGGDPNGPVLVTLSDAQAFQALRVAAAAIKDDPAISKQFYVLEEVVEE